MQRGEEPIKPQNWLIKIAHNAARSRYQRAGRRVKEVPLDDHLEQLSVAEDDRPDVEAVLEALGQLPLNQRAALVMRELEGRTYVEIGDTLDVSVAAVETLIFRARRAMRLKASSIRVLSVVQLPASLAQLLEGGGGVAVGGSAVVGYGFLFKAAVAVVAGVVATSIAAGDQVRRAHAEPGATFVAAPPWSSGAGLASVSHPVRANGQTLGSHAAALRIPAGPAEVADAPTVQATHGTSASSTSASSPTAIASTQAAVSQGASTVTSVVSSVVGSTPPITVPQLPQVQLPPPPPPPPLP
jgi:hypothetical protein